MILRMNPPGIDFPTTMGVDAQRYSELSFEMEQLILRMIAGAKDGGLPATEFYRQVAMICDTPEELIVMLDLYIRVVIKRYGT